MNVSSNEEENVPESLYKYLMTVVRRNGIEDIRIRIFIRSDGEVALVAKKDGRGNHHLLPCCNLDRNADGKEMEDVIKDMVEKAGLKMSCVRKYLRSRDCSGKMKYFDFEVVVEKRKSDNVKWIKKADVGRLNLPEAEKRILKDYFETD